MTDKKRGGSGKIPRLAFRSPEMAEALGISERTLWQLTKSGVIPCVKLGTKNKSVRYLPDVVLAVLTDRMQTQLAGGGNGGEPRISGE